MGLFRRCHRAGMVVSTRVVLPWVYPVRVSSAALVARSSTGPNGTGVSPTCWDPTRPRIRVSQRPNTIAARDRAAAGSRSAHPVAQRSERQRVDPRGQARADLEGRHPQGGAQALVLVLGVAQDQGAVPEVHHPQDERLGGGGLPAPGLAEADDVGVGHPHVVAQNPAHRVAVERPTGQDVDAHLRPGRGQAGGGDERPQRGGLVRGHPPRGHRGPHRGRPPGAGTARAAPRRPPEQPPLRGSLRHWGGGG